MVWVLPPNSGCLLFPRISFIRVAQRSQRHPADFGHDAAPSVECCPDKLVGYFTYSSLALATLTGVTLQDQVRSEKSIKLIWRLNLTSTIPETAFSIK